MYNLKKIQGLTEVDDGDALNALQVLLHQVTDRRQLDFRLSLRRFVSIRSFLSSRGWWRVKTLSQRLRAFLDTVVVVRRNQRVVG